jgi:hypothetical protein
MVMPLGRGGQSRRWKFADGHLSTGEACLTARTKLEAEKHQEEGKWSCHLVSRRELTTRKYPTQIGIRCRASDVPQLHHLETALVERAVKAALPDDARASKPALYLLNAALSGEQEGLVVLCCVTPGG